MNYRSVAEIFSQISGIYDRFLSLATAGRIHSWQKRLITLMGEGHSWLDVGTGTAGLVSKLPQGCFKVGLDPAMGMLLVAKERCLQNCYLVQGVGEALPFRSETFDCISLSLVFRHLENKDAFLKEAHRVLKKGGKVGIIDIGRFRGTGFVLFLMKSLFKPLGMAIFGKEKWTFFVHSVEESHTTEQVRKMLQERDFRVLHVEKKLMGLVHIVIGVKSS